MDVLLLAGRILLGALFVFSGATVHQSKEGVEYARASGAPAAHLLVPLSGLAMVAGGISIALGLYADLGALVLLAALAPITFYMHAFWRLQGAEREDQVFNFLKNLQVLGGLLVLFWAYNQGQDLPLSLTESLFEPL